MIEAQLPADDVSKLRSAFEAELAHGLEYQQAYQRYEMEHIAAGENPDDAHFYDAFRARQGAIASVVGPEDQFPTHGEAFSRRFISPEVLLFTGLGTLVGSGFAWLCIWFVQIHYQHGPAIRSKSFPSDHKVE